ncbi:hypothetical protein ACFLU6_08550 [Acidobacteriota bacterium]
MERADKALLYFSLALFVFVIIRTAWICDDAYITFRTVDNFVHGHGLRWNPSERVQTYTHPLWMFMFTLAYAFTRETFYTGILLTIGISLAAVLLLGLRLAVSARSGFVGVLILTLSKAFTDYSTSGMENPLTHVILAAFLLIHFKRLSGEQKLFWLSLVAALGMLNRMDTALLFLPLVLTALVRLGRWKRGSAILIIGFLPFIAWECFSLFYYGFLFPNTAYAKLNTGFGIADLAPHGLAYFGNSIRLDPLTLTVVGLAIVFTFIKKNWSNAPVVIGMVLYLIYVVRIGGDFMSGRFFAAPLFCAAALLVRWKIDFPSLLTFLLSIALLVGLVGPHCPLFSTTAYGKITEEKPWKVHIDKRGIADERAFYYPKAGLLTVGRSTLKPATWGAERGRSLHEQGEAVVVSGGAGCIAFFAGPKVHIIDYHALGDPLLARLPALRFDPVWTGMRPDLAALHENWRIGHFIRSIPQGYVETVETGRNELTNKKLGRYYDRLSNVTRGDLLSLERLLDIWRFNTNGYAHLIEAGEILNPVERKLSEISRQIPEGAPLDGPGVVPFSYAGIRIDLERVRHARTIDISLDRGSDLYMIAYGQDQTWLQLDKIRPPQHTKPGLHTHRIDVGQPMAARGFNALWIFPVVRDGRYALGYLRLHGTSAE